MYSHTVIRLRFVQFKCDIKVIECINMFGIFQKVFYYALCSIFFFKMFVGIKLAVDPYAPRQYVVRCFYRMRFRVFKRSCHF